MTRVQRQSVSLISSRALLLACALTACSEPPCSDGFGRAADGVCYPLASAGGLDSGATDDTSSATDSDASDDTDTNTDNNTSDDTDSDAGCEDCPEDADRDGYNEDEDCDESDPAVNPAAVEVRCSGVDEDCDGMDDDHPDADGDGYDACPEGTAGADDQPEDCDDSDPSVAPGALEISDSVDNDCDGLVLVGAGPFLMGSNTLPEYGPLHEVDVPAFAIHRYEVSNAEYAAFLNDVGSNVCATGVECYDADDNEKDGRLYQHDDDSWRVLEGWEQHPMVEVTWFGAQDYCAWAGLRLPTEAEWEKTARGGCELRGVEDCHEDEDLPSYTWGASDASPTDTKYANASQVLGTTAPVGSYPLGDSPYGASDMAGNAWEWVQDCWHPDYFEAPDDGSAWLEFCAGDLMPRRGGSYSTSITESTVYIRFSSSQPASNNDAGFRCVHTVE